MSDIMAICLIFCLTYPIATQSLPAKVQGVTVGRTVQGSSPALRVTWSAVSGSGITYTVCYSTAIGTQSDPPPGANCGTRLTGTSTTLSSLSRGTTYYIWVAAGSAHGRGPYSDRVQERTYRVSREVTVVIDGYTVHSTQSSPASLPLGTALVLVCRVSGIPQRQIKYNWKCPDGPCERPGHVGRKVVNGNILATNITSDSDGGTYTCEVSRDEKDGGYCQNYTLNVLGGHVIHSYGRLVHHEHVITRGDQLLPPDDVAGPGRMDCIRTAPETARWNVAFVGGQPPNNSVNNSDGGDDQMATLFFNRSYLSTNTFKNAEGYCGEYFYLYLIPGTLSNVTIMIAVSSTTDARIVLNDIPSDIGRVNVGYERHDLGVTLQGEYANIFRSTQHTFSSLVPGARYTVVVQGLSASIGDRSQHVTRKDVKSAEKKPSAPRHPCILEESSDGIELNWIPPLEPNGDVHYLIDDGNRKVTFSSGSTYFNLTGLQRGVTYNITVVAVNSAGKSDTGAVLQYTQKFPVAVISHKVTQGEILCSTQDSTTYQGDRYCLYVEDSGGERHEVECDDRPVSRDAEKLKKWGNTAVCTVSITNVNPPGYSDTTKYEIPDAIAVYGGMFSLKCGEVGSCVPKGDWHHNGELLQRNSTTTLTVRNATFENDGTYQCVNRGLNNSYLVAVYGQLGISPTNCDSKLNDICVKNVHRGRSVELCTEKTLMPSSMPPEGRVTKFIRAHWRREKSGEILEDLYECFENCFCVEGSQTTPPVDYHRYSDVNDSCITISDVQENEIFSLELLVNPDIEYSPRTVTFALQLQTINAPPPKHPSPVGNTDVIIILVSVAVVAVVIIVAIVVSFTTAMIIVIKYKHLKLTTNPTQSDGPQEPPSSSPSNLTVYRKKDVKTFEKIGRGSFWKVYRGKLSDSRCAIKRLRGVKKGGDHEGLVSKVLRELDMWSSLNHPNVISLYGIYHEDDINIPLLIVELMDKNLTDQLNSTFDPTHRNSLFPLKTKLSILSQVAGALDYLHCIKRVIHGDLTANNILLKENSPGSFTSKLTDFGMSRALNEQDNVMSTVQGTYSYMPPEVQNAGETTTKVDIYSFGVLCVHVLSHRFPKPLHALSVDDLGARVVVSEFNRYRPYLMELEDDEKLLEPLIEECLQYDPEDRLRPEEVIGQLNSIEGRLSLKETGPSNPSHQPSVIHQQFSGPIVSGCTISGSVMNVGSFTNGNMQSVPVVDTAPLPAPLEVIPEVSFGDNIPNTSTSLTAPSVNPA